MKIIRKKSGIEPEYEVKKERLNSDFYDTGASSWKILIVDDEPDVHAITRISMKNFMFDDRGIEFFNAMSGAEAMEILKTHCDIAAAMIDVVMETEDAGLQLVNFIRKELGNSAIRLIIRTGQPGVAPERYVIDHFDIDDYKEKTDLPTDKLYATLRTAIKAYRDISTLAELNKLNERKNYFIGMAAHDLRNPLGNIKSLIDMVQTSAQERLNAEEIEFLGLGNKVADSALNLIANLLDIVKIESGKLKLELRLTDISSLIIQSVYSVSFLAEPKRILIIYDPVEMPELMLDSARMQQVFVNLLSNAIKYSHPNTIVKISVSESDKEVIIAVKDQGQGIPADDIGKLFELFVKANVRSTGGEQSTGLGLLICKKITEVHGGRIWVESQIGVGSTFFVAIPK